MKNCLLLLHFLFFSTVISHSPSFGNNSQPLAISSKCDQEADISLSPKIKNQNPRNSTDTNQSRLILLVKPHYTLKVKQLLNKSGVTQIEELGDENTLLVIASVDQLKSSIDSCGLLSVRSDVPNLAQ